MVKKRKKQRNSKKKKIENKKKNSKKEKVIKSSFLSKKTKYSIYAVLFFLAGTILTFSFFDKSGPAGEKVETFFLLIIGKLTFSLPLFFLIAGFIFLSSRFRKKPPIFLGIFLIIIGISAILEQGGIGLLMAGALLKFFGPVMKNIIWGTITLVGFLIIFQYLQREKMIALRFREKETKLPPLFSQKAQKIKKEEISKPKKIFKIFSTHRLPKGEELKIGEKPVFAKKKILPPLDLLEKSKENAIAGNIKQNSEIIRKTLENFGIPVEMGGVHIGSTVTQYTLRPAEGIKLSKITNLSNNLSLALASHPIRIEAPIPGESLVGIEIPNSKRSLVRMRDLFSNSIFQDPSSPLLFCLGKDVSGFPVFADLGQMPHLLVAGATGTGKTIFLNNLILSLLYKNSPQDLKFILIDPKRVEFSVYENIPHLLSPVIFEPQKTINAVNWLIGEMERRFKQIAEGKARDILSYNKKFPQNRLSYILLIIDELADLMMARGREIETGVVRLAQLARAVGIHLVVATQRPSVEVITGLIKANITSRISFQVASQVDSRTVLDMAGSEKLLGLGDMLFISSKNPKPKRIQSPYVSEKELKNVMDFLKKNAETEEDATDEITESLKEELKMPPITTEQTFTEDILYDQAKKIVIESKKASASLLQRRLRVGYARAARLIDMLEERGVVGPGEGAKPRKIYFEKEEFVEEDESIDNFN